MGYIVDITEKKPVSHSFDDFDYWVDKSGKKKNLSKLGLDYLLNIREHILKHRNCTHGALMVIEKYIKKNEMCELLYLTSN